MTPASLAALHSRCFESPPPWNEASFRSSLDDPLTFLLVEGNTAFLLGRALAGEAELLTLAVAPEMRRRGLGRLLVGRFLHQAQARGADRAFLEVAADNLSALALYESAGFARVGLRRAYYRTPTDARVDALVLARDLLHAPKP